jgi:phospholipid/cholesterol/gamma-HCH transport system substrate-binding protein
VLVRGVQVGEVRSIAANGSGATLTLAIYPGMVKDVPANVSAEMVPTTLFGERYVDLLLPSHPVAQRLGNGSVIAQDRSRDAIEVETVLNNLLPELTAVQPQDLSVTLTAMSQALQGRGTQLGRTLTELNTYLGKFDPQLKSLDNDIRELATVSRTYTQASPSILQALNDFTVVNQTIVAEQANLSALFTTLTQSDNDLNAFLTQNHSNIIGLSSRGLPTLRILARYSSEFPCVLQDLVKFEPAINKVLGQGSSEPGLHVSVNVEEPLGNSAEQAGEYTTKDKPVFGDNTGPHCYGVPFPGIVLNDGASPAAPLEAGAASTTAGTTGTHTTAAGTGASTSDASTTADVSGLSIANSPQENELVNEISALALHLTPRSLPSWSSLLVGPLYRGRVVRVG